MDDAEIRKVLLEHARPVGADYHVYSTAFDASIRTPIRDWVERQEGGRVEAHAARRCTPGLRPNQRTVREDSYVPPWELYVFPRAALDVD